MNAVYLGHRNWYYNSPYTTGLRLKTAILNGEIQPDDTVVIYMIDDDQGGFSTKECTARQFIEQYS